MNELGAALSGLAIALRLVEMAMKLHGIPEDAKVFANLVKQVEMDAKYARKCKKEAEAMGMLQHQHRPDFFRQWVTDAIENTFAALENLGNLILKETGESIDERVRYFLKNYEQLRNQERSLRYAHTTLMTAVNALHLLMFQGPTPGSGRPTVTATHSDGLSQRVPHQLPRYQLPLVGLTGEQGQNLDQLDG
ncbi:hypothetical protein HJFPF1_10784 [Paramyrothecium foliicola]|nr:hypothetical protein HJFPF1_10784 [Paramyrothecium foliicola]